MKRWLVPLLLCASPVLADVGYVETLEHSPFPGTYCLGVGIMASAGARAAWRGTPLEFKTLSRDDYAALVRDQIAANGSAEMPNDAIYMVSDGDTEQEVTAQRRILAYGWRWMQEHASDALPILDLEDHRAPDWGQISNLIAKDCGERGVGWRP